MRASSSWIKLQFVVRKHVMNTYQMHTFSLFLFYHIFSTSLSPCSLIFLVFLSLPPVSPAHFLSVVLMVCHTDVTYSAVLYNVALYMYMCMHMWAQILKVHTLYMWYASEKVACVCNSCIAVYHHVSISDHFWGLWTTVCKVVHQFICCVCTSHALSDLITGLCGDVLICRL